MIRYYITGRRQLPAGVSLLDSIGRNIAAGVDMIQIREKDMAARELLEAARAAVALARPRGTKILINSRVDVALAAGADGVHLPADSAAPGHIRRIMPVGFLIGVSCHRVEEVIAAEREGADFVVFGPVFPTPLKSEPAGLMRLGEAARAVSIPVIALGGVDEVNAADCLAAGAVGIAGIRMFQR